MDHEQSWILWTSQITAGHIRHFHSRRIALHCIVLFGWVQCPHVHIQSIRSFNTTTAAAILLHRTFGHSLRSVYGHLRSMTVARKRPATSAENAGGNGSGSVPKLRGLLISSTHIQKFLAPNLERKTAEIRNFNCRVISKGSQFFLVESGLKDSRGKGVWRAVARVEFGGNSFVKHEDLEVHFAKHRCTRREYEQVRQHWQADKKGFVMWGIKLLEVLGVLGAEGGRGQTSFFWQGYHGVQSTALCNGPNNSSTSNNKQTQPKSI